MCGGLGLRVLLGVHGRYWDHHWSCRKKKEYGYECICHPSLQCICSLRSLLVITLFTFQQSLNEKLGKYLSTATDYCL